MRRTVELILTINATVAKKVQVLICKLYSEKHHLYTCIPSQLTVAKTKADSEGGKQHLTLCDVTKGTCLDLLRIIMPCCGKRETRLLCFIQVDVKKKIITQNIFIVDTTRSPTIIFRPSARFLSWLPATVLESGGSPSQLRIQPSEKLRAADNFLSGLKCLC